MISIKHLDNLLPKIGLDSILLIQQDSGKPINSLKTPGFVNQALIDRWEQDLTVDGVFKGDGQGGRHPVCPYDLANLDSAGECFLNSCSEQLSLHIQDALVANGKDPNGLQVFFQIISKCYRPSSAVVKDKIKHLEAMDIRKFAGQNVTLYNQEAYTVISEIKLNLQMANQCPELGLAALLGLTKGDDVYFAMQVKEKRRSLKVDLTALSGTPVQVEKALDEWEELTGSSQTWYKF